MAVSAFICLISQLLTYVRGLVICSGQNKKKNEFVDMKETLISVWEMYTYFTALNASIKMPALSAAYDKE